MSAQRCHLLTELWLNKHKLRCPTEQSVEALRGTEPEVLGQSLSGGSGGPLAHFSFHLCFGSLMFLLSSLNVHHSFSVTLRFWGPTGPWQHLCSFSDLFCCRADRSVGPGSVQLSAVGQMDSHLTPELFGPQRSSWSTLKEPNPPGTVSVCGSGRERFSSGLDQGVK